MQSALRHGMKAVVAVASTLLLLLSLAAGIARAATSDIVPEFSVVATLEESSDQEPLLAFHLTNKSPGLVEMYQSDLPWGIQDSLSLSLFRLDETGCAKVEEYYLIDDPGPDTLVIGPGMTLTGRVDLSGRFDGLKASDRHADFLLRWRYVPTTADFVTGKLSSGWIIIPAAQSQ